MNVYLLFTCEFAIGVNNTSDFSMLSSCNKFAADFLKSCLNLVFYLLLLEAHLLIPTTKLFLLFLLSPMYPNIPVTVNFPQVRGTDCFISLVYILAKCQ